MRQSKFGFNWTTVSEKKIFEIVNGRRTDDDGRTPEHGCTVSSPCEPNGSCELKSEIAKRHEHIHTYGISSKRTICSSQA